MPASDYQLDVVPDKVKILVVDDNPDNLVTLEAVLTLKHDDRTIIKATSGHDALKYLLDESVAIVLLDVKMDGMDGYETAALIREREKTRDLPILFMTAYHTAEADVLKGYGYGAVDYIVKPFDPDVLCAKVNCFVELAQRSEGLRKANECLRQAERELLKSKVAESLIKQVPDPIFVSDLHGKILQANDAACDLLGFEMDELIQQRVSRFLTSQETESFTHVLKDVAHDGAKKNVRLNPRDAGGEVIPTILNVSALKNDEAQVVGAIGTLRDMRPHDDLVRSLEQSKAALQEKIEDLEKFEEVVVGRELKMIELEKENERLKEQVRGCSCGAARPSV